MSYHYLLILTENARSPAEARMSVNTYTLYLYMNDVKVYIYNVLQTTIRYNE